MDAKSGRFSTPRPADNDRCVLFDDCKIRDRISQHQMTYLCDHVTTGSRLALSNLCERPIWNKISMAITATSTIVPLRTNCLIACCLTPGRARLRPCPRRELTSMTDFLANFFFPDISALSMSYRIGSTPEQARRWIGRLCRSSSSSDGLRPSDPPGTPHSATPRNLHPLAAQG